MLLLQEYTKISIFPIFVTIFGEGVLGKDSYDGA